MLVTTDCIPCYFFQALSSAKYVKASRDKQAEVLYEVARLLPELTFDVSPAHNSTLVLRLANRILGVEDPYREAKEHYNRLITDMYPRLREMVDNSPSSLDMAARLSVVGNIIDLGIKAEIDIEGTIAQVINEGFALDNSGILFGMLDEKPRTVLFLVDNAGEIAFDRPFVEEMVKRGHRVVVGVKSGPILNDATMEDAIQVGMDKVTEVVETGSDWVGTNLPTCSDDFKKLYENADIVIAKGQANYETIEGSREDLFLILKAKCESVAENIGVPLGKMVFLKSNLNSA